MIEESIAVIRALLQHLPDSDQQTREDWNHCWDELGDDSQEAVKLVRMMANQFCLKLGEMSSKMPIFGSSTHKHRNKNRVYLVYGIKKQGDKS